ncbi:MAG: nitrite and sulphite reductase 4Fe-4S region [Acidobacteria bacterium]|jgi:sulfite reductase (ferredoxin)|nr:nitrite and sulphite reductase 4Fe-4S region [Acidobacteriota bacterium]
MAVVKKENKVERVKRERDGLDSLESIIAYAREGFQSISEDDLTVRLRWYGLYTQRPETDGYFMLRVKVPNGTLSSLQLETLGRLSVRYAKSTGDVTTRQGIQFHNIRIEDVPSIFAELNNVGLSTTGACGDITRNVTGCPLAGIDGAELINAEPIVEKIHNHFLGNHEFSNLPRKFKITVSGCSLYCTGHEINDIGLVALRRPEGVVFDLWVGGGLGAKERFGERLGVHISPEQVVEVAHHICGIFRDNGNRDSRALARLKFLMADWGAERFRDELERRLGYQLTRGEAPKVPFSTNRAHIGIHPQNEPGLVYIGASTTGGLLSGEQMIEIAKIAREQGGSRIRLTPTQNVILLDVPEQSAEIAARRLEEIKLPVRPSTFRTGTIACTGNQFCKLALTETKDRAADLIEHLETSLRGFDSPFRISVTGCPNSCAHYQICDIGFVGDFINTPEGKVEAFRVYLGGHLGDGYAFGKKLKRKILAGEIKLYVERLAREFLEKRRSEAETFQDYLARHTIEELETLGAENSTAAAINGGEAGLI